MKDFRQIRVWEKAHAVTLDAYRLSQSFPKSEVYGLTSQVRRSAMSIPTNIAEGCGRGSHGELGRFFTIAMGSASELEYQSLLARDLGYLSEASYTELRGKIIEVKKMVASYVDKVRRFPGRGRGRHGPSMPPGTSQSQPPPTI